MGDVAKEVGERLAFYRGEIERLTAEYWREHAVWQKDRKENRRLQAKVEQLEGALTRTHELVKLGRMMAADAELGAAIKGGDDYGCSLCSDPLAKMPSWENRCPRCGRDLPQLPTGRG